MTGNALPMGLVIATGLVATKHASVQSQARDVDVITVSVIVRARQSSFSTSLRHDSHEEEYRHRSRRDAEKVRIYFD